MHCQSLRHSESLEFQFRLLSRVLERQRESRRLTTLEDQFKVKQHAPTDLHTAAIARALNPRLGK